MGSRAVPAATCDDLHEDQLPPLYASLAIEGLPPFHQTVHLDEAEAELAKVAARWNIPSFHDYCRLSLFTASVAHSKVISSNRLVDISLQYCLVFLLDDLLFDAPDDDLLEGYGIHRSERESIERIQACLDRLNGSFSQTEPPINPSKIESIVWELGHDMRQLSTPDWFRYFAKTVVDYHQACIDSLAHILEGNDVDLKNVDSYIRMRVDNFAGPMICTLTEFANNAYFPEHLRPEPWAKEVIKSASSHLMLINDIYSYHKESTQEFLLINLITLLMETEGMSLAQAVRRDIELVNSNAQIIFDLEVQLMTSDSLNEEPKPVGGLDISVTTTSGSNPFVGICSPWKSAVGGFFQGIKELISGGLYYHSLHKRYRHPNSTFPELRDVNHRKVQTSDLLLLSEYGSLKIIADPTPEANYLVV